MLQKLSNLFICFSVFIIVQDDMRVLDCTRYQTATLERTANGNYRYVDGPVVMYYLGERTNPYPCYEAIQTHIEEWTDYPEKGGKPIRMIEKK